MQPIALTVKKEKKMTSLLVIISITSMVTQNSLFNNVCKKELKTNNHIYYFNTFVYLICIVLFGAMLINSTVSAYTLISGIVFGIITALSNLYRMLALSKGPMNITLLITTSSMIIPTMSGVFFGERFSLMKLLMVAILLVFIYISLDNKDNSGINKKWILFCALAFIFQGSVGVLQKVHQTSVHRDEVSGFLFMAFICSFIYNRIRIKGGTKELKFSKKHIAIALICGLCTFLMNFLNLKLSGLLPSQLFFPLVNGSSIVLCSLMAIIVFKERPTKKQLIGLIGGIISLIAICLVK